MGCFAEAAAYPAWAPSEGTDHRAVWVLLPSVLLAVFAVVVLVVVQFALVTVLIGVLAA